MIRILIALVAISIRYRLVAVSFASKDYTLNTPLRILQVSTLIVPSPRCCLVPTKMGISMPSRNTASPQNVALGFIITMTKIATYRLSPVV